MSVKVNTQSLLNPQSSTQLIGVCRQAWQRDSPHSAWNHIQGIRKNKNAYVVQYLWVLGSELLEQCPGDISTEIRKVSLYGQNAERRHSQFSLQQQSGVSKIVIQYEIDQLNTFNGMNTHKAKYEDYGKLLKPQESWSEKQLNITSLIMLGQKKSYSIATILTCAAEKQYGVKK